MNISILSILLLLSIVNQTDSCSSFTRWKFREVDVSAKELCENIETKMTPPPPPPPIITTTTTERIDIIHVNNDNINASRIIYIPIKTPLILPPGATFERCEKSFEGIFCNQRGKCITIDYHTGERPHAQCICDIGFKEPNCMEKSPDNYYLTVKNRQDLAQEHSETSTTTTTTTTTTTMPTVKRVPIARRTTTERPTFVENLGEEVPCPDDKKDHCVFGDCFMIPSLSDDDYFCKCHLDYTGPTCSQKVTDYHYETLVPTNNRERRDASATKRRKYRMNRRFRVAT